METVAEKRARLRRMKILENSQDRLNRIITGVCLNPPNVTKAVNCDIHSEHNQSKRVEIHSISSSEDSSKIFKVLEKSKPHQVNSLESDPILQLFGRGDQVLPRKVSLIATPTHYRTLQQSQEFNSSLLNHPNIINNFRCNESSKFMIVLVIMALINSYFGVNIFVYFIIFQTFKFMLYKSTTPRSPFYLTITKELTVCIFSYVLIQAAIQVFK